jgi:predicted chitinase
MAATIAVETGNFRPTKELRGWPDTALWKHQEKYWPAGYFGRGYIQLMEQHNYQAAGQALDIDLVSNPDLALDPKTAALIAAWYFETNNIHSFCEASNWNAVRSTVSGPGYLKSESWSRFKRYCDALALKVAV